MADEINLSRDSLNQLADLVASRSSRSSGGSSGSSGGGISFDPLKKFNDGVDVAVTGLTKLATGSATAADALGLVSSGLGKIPGIGDSLSTITDKFGKGALQANDALNETGKSGITMRNNIGLLSETMNGARMTLPEFQRSMKENSTAISGLGKNVDNAAINILTLAKDIHEGGSEAVEKMKKAGVGPEEFNQSLMIVAGNNRKLNLEDKKSREMVIDTAIQMSSEMDKVARLTGKSREEQQKDLQASMAKAEVQAELLQMDQEGIAQYQLMKTAVGPLGKSMQDLADEIATGGVRTEEGAAKMAALGPAAASFEDAVLAMKNAKNDDEKRAAAAQMERAKQEISAYQASKEYADTVRYGNTEVNKQAREMLTQNKELNSRITGAKADEAKSSEEIAKERDIAAAQAREGVDTKTGKVDPGAATGQTINEFNRTLKDGSAGVGIALNDLAKEIGGSKALAKVREGLQPRTGAEMYEPAKDMINKAGEMMDKAKNAVNPAGTANPAARREGWVSRDTGSLGSVGKLIEDFGKGTPAMLHGKEGIITEDQLKNVVSSAKGSGIEGMMSSMKNAAGGGLGGVTSMISSLKSAMPAPVPTPAKASSTESTSTKSTQTTGKETTLNDLNQQLIDLNSKIGQLVATSIQSNTHAEEQLRATKGLSGDRFAF